MANGLAVISERKDQKLLFPVILDRVYLSNSSIPQESFHDDCFFFDTDQELAYVPFCDDFGPMNLACIIKFTEILEKHLTQHPFERIVYMVQNTPRKLTNAIFLLGSYLILVHSESPEGTWERFHLLENRLEMYRDATFSVGDFRLALIDCWRGLYQANRINWLKAYDMEEYVHYDNPLEGDLHIMVPGKLIAFRGPRTLPDSRTHLDENGTRIFSPGFYLEPFADLEVSTVIRLNEAHYDPAAFENHGVRCVDLEFEDCTAPPNHVLLEFLHTIDRATGAVAVHCKAGLGRTGTLIAVYMMRHHGFTARDAMGWLRIVRPGAVIGDQQLFLCSLDKPPLSHIHSDLTAAVEAAAATSAVATDSDEAVTTAIQVAQAPTCPPGGAAARAHSPDGIRVGSVDVAPCRTAQSCTGGSPPGPAPPPIRPPLESPHRSCNVLHRPAGLECNCLCGCGCRCINGAAPATATSAAASAAIASEAVVAGAAALPSGLLPAAASTRSGGDADGAVSAGAGRTSLSASPAATLAAQIAAALNCADRTAARSWLARRLFT